MFVVRKRNFIIFTALFLTAITFVLCFAALAKTSAIAAKSGVKVVLDAGHGGIDGGVSGIKTGVHESDINLAIVKKLEKYLIDAGITVVLTRSSSAGLYGVASSTLKRRDMEKRKAIIQKAQPTLVVSVHMNYYPNSSRRGGQVFFKKGSEKSEILAKSIQKSLNTLYADVKDYSPLTGDYYILNCTEYPTVIAECGFLSNLVDESLLTDENFRSELAYSLFYGIINYLTESSIVYF
ncbi:MAG: N-acetylmuramoyl-L-alanine amidase [Clostridia bacterium]|nr:N-acetylmuramoyl-L-alanine amidase [Clostridia bacterium]